ncbi:UNVERIFIED_CONTAM: hypothetical protein FKN15_060007 [Acipenser sinensis]
MDRNVLEELLEALESRQDAEERRREERYNALIERVGLALSTVPAPTAAPAIFCLDRDTVDSCPSEQPTLTSLSSNTTTTISPGTQTSETADPNGPPCLPSMETKVGPQLG